MSAHTLRASPTTTSAATVSPALCPHTSPTLHSDLPQIIFVNDQAAAGTSMGTTGSPGAQTTSSTCRATASARPSWRAPWPATRPWSRPPLWRCRTRSRARPSTPLSSAARASSSPPILRSALGAFGMGWGSKTTPSDVLYPTSILALCRRRCGRRCATTLAPLPRQSSSRTPRGCPRRARVCCAWMLVAPLLFRILATVSHPSICCKLCRQDHAPRPAQDCHQV